MCFSWTWLAQVLVWLVIICAIIAILKLLIPWVLSRLAISIDLGPIPAIIRIVFIAAITIFVIWICVDLISCLGGLSFPRLR